MIKCKNCGAESYRYDILCPECNTQRELSETECRELIKEAAQKREQSDYLIAVEIYKLLASVGNREGERELGIILENGKLVPRDLDMAVRYFYSAAKKGDPLAAYRYSHLAVGNEAICKFWLAFSALMGCKEAYPDAFDLYDGYKEKRIAAYYCSLLADEDDTDAIIEMARRHLYGEGVEQNERMAKWYIERIDRVPLHALKLHRRLSAVMGRSLRPEPPSFTDRKRITERLISAAKKFGYSKILLVLSKSYAEIAGRDSEVYLALMHIEGVEFTKNVDLGISMLKEAVSKGSVAAAKRLGDLYAEGKHLERDAEKALNHYRQAAMLGGKGEYEALGDILSSDTLGQPDYALALSLYERGAEGGDWGCQKKLSQMKDERERCYVEATHLERSSPEEAFKLFKKSVECGYIPAHARIGWYYERGIGTKIDRKKAFVHYSAAYEAGDKRATESLGRCYARGIGTAFNFKKASELLSIAREMGSRSADKELFRIYENKKKHMVRSLYSTAMRLYFNKKYDVAKDMLTICMDLGLGDATYAIGCMYEFGIYVGPDRKIALRYYKRALEQGYNDHRQYHKQSMLRIWKQN